MGILNATVNMISIICEEWPFLGAIGYSVKNKSAGTWLLVFQWQPFQVLALQSQRKSLTSLALSFFFINDYNDSTYLKGLVWSLKEIINIKYQFIADTHNNECMIPNLNIFFSLRKLVILKWIFKGFDNYLLFTC